MQTSDSGQEYISISIDNTQAKNKAKETADSFSSIGKSAERAGKRMDDAVERLGRQAAAQARYVAELNKQYSDQIYKAQQTGSHWATKPSPTLQGYMYIDPTDGALSYDVQKVYDECTKYLTNAEKPAYDKLTQIAKELNDLTKGKFVIEQLLQTATVNPDTHETLCVVNPRAPFAELAMMMG
jgi:hypothetical protein